jgi:hypothetical protein
MLLIVVVIKKLTFYQSIFFIDMVSAQQGRLYSSELQR